MGFEPMIRFWRILTFQASAFDHSAISPGRVPGIVLNLNDTYTFWGANLQKKLQKCFYSNFYPTIVTGKCVPTEGLCRCKMITAYKSALPSKN